MKECCFSKETYHLSKAPETLDITCESCPSSRDVARALTAVTTTPRQFLTNRCCVTLGRTRSQGFRCCGPLHCVLAKHRHALDLGRLVCIQGCARLGSGLFQYRLVHGREGGGRGVRAWTSPVQGLSFSPNSGTNSCGKIPSSNRACQIQGGLFEQKKRLWQDSYLRQGL